MTNSRYWVRSRGKVQGPFTLDELRTRRDRGLLARFHELSDDHASWFPAARLTDLFPPVQAPRASYSEAEPVEDSSVDDEPEVEWYYLDPSARQQLGPITEAELLDLYRMGTIQLQTRVWHDPLPDWLPLRDAFPIAGGSTAPLLGPIDWTPVASGVALLLLGAGAWLAATVVGRLDLVFDFTTGMPRLGLALSFVALLLQAAAATIDLVGAWNCLSVKADAPVQRSAWRLLVVCGITVGHVALALLLHALHDFRGDPEKLEGLPSLERVVWFFAITAMDGGVLLMAALQPLFIQFFYRSVAQNLQDIDLARRLTHLLVFYAVVLVLLLLWGGFSSILGMASFFGPGSTPRNMKLGSGVLVGVIWLAWYGWYVRESLKLRKRLEG